MLASQAKGNCTETGHSVSKVPCQKSPTKNMSPITRKISGTEMKLMHCQLTTEFRYSTMKELERHLQ